MTILKLKVCGFKFGAFGGQQLMLGLGLDSFLTKAPAGAHTSTIMEI